MVLYFCDIDEPSSSRVFLSGGIVSACATVFACGLALLLVTVFLVPGITQRGAELWKMLGDVKTCVYVAGLEKMRPELDVVFAGLAGSMEKWQRRKAELMAGGRWVELLY